jgi:ribosomal-protein-alanine N-acetyltransferase
MSGRPGCDARDPERTACDALLVDSAACEPGSDAGDDFIITLEGQVIGKAGCWRLPQIGFILHPDCWGKGLAREAVAAVIERLFVEHGLAEITADVDPRNQSSLGLLERLGFRETSRAARTWHVGDEWCDSVYLALNREDWRHP